MIIIAVIGYEAHSTSNGWSRITINGHLKSYRDAVSTKRLSAWGDKHAFWCECIFKVEAGAIIHWEAGTNNGSRGANRDRRLNTYRVDASVEPRGVEEMGYPAQKARLEGRLVLARDHVGEVTAAHSALKSEL